MSKQSDMTCIREWVQVLLRDPKAAGLPTLERLSPADLAALAVAIDIAGAEWMSTLVHEALKKPEPSPEPKWSRKP